MNVFDLDIPRLSSATRRLATAASGNIPAVETMVIGEAPTLDEGDVEAAWMLCQNPGMKAFGPNDVTWRK